MRSLNLIAHPDDDLLFFNTDLAYDILNGDEVHIVYFTAGDDGKGVNEWMRKLPALEAVYGAYPNVKYRTLGVKSNSHRTGDTWGDLYKMWHSEDYKTNNIYGSPYDRQWLARQLDISMMIAKPDILRIHNPFSDPAIDHDAPGLDHLDHIYAGKFGAELASRFVIDTLAYMGYPIRHLSDNLSPADTELKKKFWRTYQAHEPEVQGEQWDIALSRCYPIQL